MEINSLNSFCKILWQLRLSFYITDAGDDDDDDDDDAEDGGGGGGGGGVDGTDHSIAII